MQVLGQWDVNHVHSSASNSFFPSLFSENERLIIQSQSISTLYRSKYSKVCFPIHKNESSFFWKVGWVKRKSLNKIEYCTPLCMLPVRSAKEFLASAIRSLNYCRSGTNLVCEFAIHFQEAGNLLIWASGLIQPFSFIDVCNDEDSITSIAQKRHVCWSWRSLNLEVDRFANIHADATKAPRVLLSKHYYILKEPQVMKAS